MEMREEKGQEVNLPTRGKRKEREKKGKGYQQWTRLRLFVIDGHLSKSELSQSCTSIGRTDTS